MKPKEDIIFTKNIIVVHFPFLLLTASISRPLLAIEHVNGVSSAAKLSQKELKHCHLLGKHFHLKVCTVIYSVTTSI